MYIKSVRRRNNFLKKNCKSFATLKCNLQKLMVEPERQVEKSCFFLESLQIEKILGSRLKIILSKLLPHRKTKALK